MSDVYLYVYDLTKGMARQFSAMFLGKHFDGIWHTGIVAFGREWYFGNDGIDSCPPKGTVLGEPNEMLHLGRIELNEEDFQEIIRQMSETSYQIGSYNLLEHNCNNFSNDLSQLLVGKPIPSHIIDLPKEILNTPLGPMLRPLLEQAADPLHRGGANGSLFGTGRATNQAATSNQATRPKLPMPITMTLFKEKLSDEILENSRLQSMISKKDSELLAEIKDYLGQNEAKFSIGNTHIKVLFKIYFEKDLSEFKMNITKIFEQLALTETAARLIINDSQFISSFLPKIKDLASDQLKASSLQMMSNLCSHKSISETLMESSQDALFKDLSDFALIETKNDAEKSIHEAGISFFFNLISAYHLEKKLNDSNALTLGCALLERLPKMQSKPKTIYHMLSLLRSCLSNSQSMRELAVSMEFDLAKYKMQTREQNEFSHSLERANDSSSEKNDYYDAVLSGIDHLIHK